MTPSTSLPNPYVGPRTFEAADRTRFFGREQEAAALLARVISERLLLFYAQSGAGKSSLLNARLIPQLRKEEGFGVLPVGRVAGALPAGAAQVDNIFLFNLKASLDQSGSGSTAWAQQSLSDFLEHLVTDDGLAWRYDPAAAAAAEPAAQGAGAAGEAGPAPRFALIIDQFEEIITGHPDRWREREGFFRQLDAALQANPNLWIVLTLREDYVAALDPFAPLVFNRLRARFYMERMGVAAALDAIRKPAELGNRPFATGVAEQLVDNLRQVRVPGQEATVPGQYVEPVQLQVVCYQLWENLEGSEVRDQRSEDGKEIGIDTRGMISVEDLARAGDVDRALAQFYEETLAAALADQAAAGVSERQVRSWFDEELITEAGTRGLVRQGESETGSLPNVVVRALQRRFLVRGEVRSGDTWIELTHDRLVRPVGSANRAWRDRHAAELKTNLAELGWGVIFAADIGPDVREALAPLLALRRAQTTAQRGFYREYSGPESCHPGETARAFLERHHAPIDRLSPDRMPYYLLIVGDPEAIPFEFQYELDAQYAVGRLYFKTPEEYARYASSVVAAENGEITLPCRATFFATPHHDDMIETCKALANRMKATHPAWVIETILQSEATKLRLVGLLGGGSRPAFLTTAGWGARFLSGDSRQEGDQGALVTSEWLGDGPPISLAPGDYFSAADVANSARLEGAVALMLGSYTAGTPARQSPSGEQALEPKTSAPRAFLARLPQRLLGHPNGGMLAIIGHIDVLWSTSFRAESEVPGLFAFETTVERLLSGSTVGAAVQALNERYRALATALAPELQRHQLSKKRTESDELRRLKLETVDARNYVVIGDPAVRLPVAWRRYVDRVGA
jgi:hypothetical protein